MSGKRIFVGLIAAILGVILILSVVTSQKTGSPQNPKSTMTNESTFPFELGAVNYENFAKRVIPANKAIKTLHVQSVSEVTTASGKDVVTTTGVVDQRNAGGVMYSITVDDNGVKSEHIRIRSAFWDRMGTENKWVRTENPSEYGVTTSTDFFQGFVSTTRNPVKELTYDGKDVVGHKFSMSVDLNQLLNDDSKPLGFSESQFWLDDQLRMLRQETIITSESGNTSFLVNEQKDFNEDVEIFEPQT